MKQLNEAVASKARRLEQVAQGLEGVEAAMGWKASQQSVVEVHTEVCDLQHQLVLKVEQRAVEELRGEIRRLALAAGEKAGAQEFRELRAQVLQNFDDKNWQ